MVECEMKSKGKVGIQMSLIFLADSVYFSFKNSQPILFPEPAAHQ